jgi:ribosomal protein L16 Arg81 hydroxylase
MERANHTTLDLAWLLAPLDPQSFFASYWEQRHLHLSGRDAAYYQPLLSADALETFLNTADLRYPALQLAKDGHYYAPETYTRDFKHGSECFAAVPDFERVAAEYRNGATLSLPALQRTWAPLGTLCRTLEGLLDHKVHANAYLTPGNASGFTPHYDVHEVFVLQIAGHKRWSLYEPRLQLPHRSQPFNPQHYQPGPLLATLDLHPGDLLYLPRGYVHSTTTTERFSAHVTIGISVYTWVDLMREVLPNANEHPHLRRALPPGFAHKAQAAAVRRSLLAALGELATSVNPDQLLEMFVQRVRSGQSRPAEHLRIDTRVVGLDTLLRAPERSAYRIEFAQDRTVLEFQGKRYVLPAEIAPLLQAIYDRALFKPIELPAQLDETARLGLSRYLYEIGFLSAGC